MGIRGDPAVIVGCNKPRMVVACLPSQVKIQRLRKARLASGPTEHQVKSGVAGGHNKLAPNIVLLLLSVLMSQPRENAHYEKFESSKKTE